MSARQPAHLRPEACFVCGYGKMSHGKAGQHEFWSNAEARAAAAAEDAKRQPPVYSSGARTAEASYVAQHRPY